MWKGARYDQDQRNARENKPPQGAGTSQPLEWASPKRGEITSVAENVHKRELSGTVGGNAYWCSHCGKQCAGSSES